MPGYAPGVSINVMIGRPKFLRQPHQTQRFAIAFRIGHAKVALHALLQRAPFLMADDHNRQVVEASETAYDGPIVRKSAISVEFLKVPAEKIDIVENGWALRVTGELRALPRSELTVQIRLFLREAGLEFAQFFLNGLPSRIRPDNFSIFSSISRSGFSNSK